MLKLQGYQLKETLFSNQQTEVYRVTRESDGESLIVRTFSGGEPTVSSDNKAVSEALSHHTSGRYSRLAFTREVLAMLDHPSIVKVVDWVEGERFPALIMEDIQGIDFWAYADTFEHKQVPLKTFLKLAIQLADALSVIHHAQVIHKDLHPGNIVISPESGRVQIIDFGLASLLSREQPALATPDKLEGILAYISPEQTGRMNRALDYRSDFYTLGITFYQLLTGKLPFEADDALGMVYAHMATVQRAVKARRPEVPKSLSKLIDKLMHKNAEGRYQSALGLKFDLEQILSNLEQGHDSNFDLGEQDISSYFTIPQVLYGREQQVQTLMQHFYLASDGQPQLLCVAGYSGIGKSALVHEVHKPIAAHKGLFMQGKFDQFQQNVPFSALKRALASWLQMALSLEQNDFVALGQELNLHLGTNARVLIDFMPDFKRLLGDLPALPALGAQESQNRFYLLMQRFIKHISLQQPLVIFIDDLQWADRGTLNLLPELISEAGCRLLVIVAYRDNEVDSSHPAVQMIERLKGLYVVNDNEADQQNAQQIVSQLTLGPLPLAQIQHLLVDALHRSESDVSELAELVLQKTGGNPFFTIEFLKTLYAESLLDFDLQAQQWTWSLEAIKTKDITDNVVELMLGKMQTLPSDTQSMLQLAACVGTYFDIETLAMLAEKDMPEVAHALWPALQAGLLIQEGGDWFLGMLGQRNLLSASVSDPAQLPASELDNKEHCISDQHDEPYDKQSERRKSPWVPRCKFLHDRMLQAAYESLNEQQRQQAHLRIGRLLLQHYPEAARSQELFAIIAQLNLSLALITDDSEKRQLAQLNLHAALQAKQASVWDAALGYAYIGIELLSEASWKTDYALSFGLHLLQVECELLVANHEQGQVLAEALLEKTHSPLEKAQICFLLASQQFVLELDYCIEKCLAGLAYCGLTTPKIIQIDEHLVELEYQNLQDLLEQKSWQEQAKLNLDKTVSANISLAYRLFAQLAITAQVAGKNSLLFYAVYKGLRTALEMGPNEHAIVLYTIYSSGSAKQARYEEANQAATIALSLLKHYPHCTDAPFIHTSLGSFVWFYHQPFQQSIKLQKKAHELGYEYGDLSRGVFAGYSNAQINHYAQGLNIRQLQANLSTLETLIYKHAIKVSAGSYYSRLITMLTQPDASNQFVASAFAVEEWQLIQSCILKAFIEHLHIQACFWRDQLSEAWEAVQAAEASLPMMSGFITALEQRFIAALLSIRSLSRRQAEGSHISKEAEGGHAFIQRSLSELEELNDLCPENFEHKLALLQAEIALAEGQSIEVLMPLYQQAIDSAEANGFLQYQALANELYGRAWLSKNINPMAKIHLQHAKTLYRNWGCTVKVHNLKNEFVDLFQGSASDDHSTAETKQETLVSSTKVGTQSSTQTTSLEGLDLNSVMKSALVISGELEVKNLLAKVMQVIVENSGAQQAAFILNGEQGPSIEASLYTLDNETVELEARPLNGATDLPVSLIEYVLRSERDVSLQEEPEEEQQDGHNAEKSAYADDAYLQAHRPRSVVCMPVMYRDKALGALYLENTVSGKAFPKARFDVIKMLLAQAAISYENARLFTEVTQLNVGLEDKVQQRTAEFEMANKALTAFSYTVSHDLRSPLRMIKGFSEVIIEDFYDELNPEVRMLFKKVISGGEQMDELITGLLDLARLEQTALERDKVNLSEMATSIIASIREQAPQRHASVFIEPGLSVKGDKRMLYSVIENLLNNAWKYSSKSAQTDIKFASKQVDKKCVYYVQDQGAGFDMRYEDKLFATFQRLHTSDDFAGTGVGLATVKRIIEKHEGEIWAEAEEGKGATFYFTLG